MNLITKYNDWLAFKGLPDYLYEELTQIQNSPDEINDRFWKDLSFGTGGLRGVLGAGTNRVNVLTISKATQGLANYLKKNEAAPKVAIAYDTRNFSKEFAQTVACILCANQIKVFLYSDVRPTPMLSFAVRYLKASAGIVLTASHNPKQYNGYKVYGNDGGQITDEAASLILESINSCDIFDSVAKGSLDEFIDSGLLEYVDETVDCTYFDKVKSLSLRKKLLLEQAKNLKILYTPLHGSGNIPVRRILKELGFLQVDVVAAQELPDGNFPTCPYPNPEEPQVFELAIEQAKRSHPDLIFATDPDCDRIGVLTQNSNGDYFVLTGNQVGALLCQYLIKTHLELGTMPPNPAIIKTIVTSDLGREICEAHGVFMAETLTGFKYIGELVENWTLNKSHSFLLGFEESYGYLAGAFVRDKDAVIAAALIAEMALYYKEQGVSLSEALNALYKEYGWYEDKLISVAMSGQEGQEKIKELLTHLRKSFQSVFKEDSLAIFEDYGSLLQYNLLEDTEKKLLLPPSNVLKFIFDDNSWIVFRPSGTEPKIKIYISVAASNQTDASLRMKALEAKVSSLIG